MNKAVVVVVLIVSLIQWCDAGANAPMSNQFVFSAGANFDNVIKEGEEAIINLFQRLVYSRDGRWDNGLAKREESEEDHQLEERAYVYKCASNQPITSVNGSFIFKNIDNQLIVKYFNIPANTVLIGQSGAGVCNKWESNLTGNIQLPGYFADGPKLDPISIVLTWGTFAAKQWYYQQKASWNITILNVEPTLDCSKVTVTGSSSNYNVQVAFSDPAGVYDAPYVVNTNWGDASFNTNVGAGALVSSTTTSFQNVFSNSYSGSSGTVIVTVTDKDGGQSNACQVNIKGTSSSSSTTAPQPATTGEVTTHEVPITTGEITTGEITTGSISTGEVTSGAASTGPITTRLIPITTKDLTTKVGITTKKAITTKNITTKNITTKKKRN